MGSQIQLMSKQVLSKTHAESTHLHEVPILSLATITVSSGPENTGVTFTHLWLWKDN